MKIINGYRLEKDAILNAWVAFKKVGISAWVERHKSNTYSEIKEWANAQKKKNRKRKKK